MSDGMLFASKFSRWSAWFLVCGTLLSVGLLLARQHVLAALGAMVVVAVAGALRRVQEEAAQGLHQGHNGLHAKPRGSAGNGVATRQALESTLAAELAREHRPGDPTALLLIAIDEFKQLRDQGGAMAGDVAMLTLASALTRMLPREADLLARYDECTFAVMLRGTDLPGSLRVAARLRWAIVRLGIANAATASTFLTACTGIAVVHGLVTGGTATLLSAAEKALAGAQSSGHDSLEYAVLGTESRFEPPSDRPSAAAFPQVSAAVSGLPAIRAWTAERAQVLHSPRS